MNGAPASTRGVRPVSEENPRLTIVIPTRDRPALLVRAINSVRAQELGAWELIVIDDGSADAAAQGVRDAVASVPGATLVPLCPSVGAAAARNAGLERARGELVAFLDDDDVWVPTYLARMAASLDAHPGADVAYCRRVIEADGRRHMPALPDLTQRADPLQALVAGNFIDTSTALVRRERLRAVGGFDPALPRLQDWDLWLRLARASRFVYVDDVLVESRSTGDGISASPARLVEACRLLAERRPAELRMDARARAAFFYALATVLMVGGAPEAAGPYFHRSLRERFHPRRLAAAATARLAPAFYRAVTRARRHREE